MSKRSISVGILTAGLSVGVVAGAVSPAAAQGNPVGGQGNVYFLSGALNADGQAQKINVFGDATDEVYFGDWYNTGTDLPMVRRGNLFFVPNQTNQFITETVFAYGDAGDQVLVGDWDGDGKDSLAIRRNNHFLVKNDNLKSGVADSEFFYGDAGDEVLVGNWDGAGRNLNPAVYEADGTTIKSGDIDFTDAGEYVANNTDTLMVKRDNRFFVKNDLKSGVAEYSFYFGDKGDDILVGDWAHMATKDDKATKSVDEATVSADADGADQLAVRRGFTYYQSTEFEAAFVEEKNPSTDRVFAYGDAADTVFVASYPSPELNADGKIVYAQLEIPANTPITDAEGKAIYYTSVGVPIVAGPTKGTNGSGVAVTVKDRNGTSIVIAAGGTFEDADGNVVFDPTTGLPLVADPTPNVVDATNPTLVFDKLGNEIASTTPADIIEGDGLGVRRVIK